jgi:hypothetical protein
MGSKRPSGCRNINIQDGGTKSQILKQSNKKDSSAATRIVNGGGGGCPATEEETEAPVEVPVLPLRFKAPVA